MGKNAKITIKYFNGKEKEIAGFWCSIFFYIGGAIIAGFILMGVILASPILALGYLLGKRVS